MSDSFWKLPEPLVATRWSMEVMPVYAATYFKTVLLNYGDDDFTVSQDLDGTWGITLEIDPRCCTDFNRIWRPRSVGWVMRDERHHSRITKFPTPEAAVVACEAIITEVHGRQTECPALLRAIAETEAELDAWAKLRQNGGAA